MKARVGRRRTGVRREESAVSKDTNVGREKGRESRQDEASCTEVSLRPTLRGRREREKGGEKENDREKERKIQMEPAGEPNSPTDVTPSNRSTPARRGTGS